MTKALVVDGNQTIWNWNSKCSMQRVLLPRVHRTEGLMKKTGILFVLLMLIVSAVQLEIQPAKALELSNNSCKDCHLKLPSETHQQFIEMRSRHLEMGVSCSTACHEDRLNKSTASTFGKLVLSMHAFFNATCEKCHNGNSSAGSKEKAHVGLSNITTAFTNTSETCGKCHQLELEEFMSSEHFKGLLSGEKPAPTCLSCHQTHSMRELTASEREDFCNNCHASFNENCKKCHINASAVSGREVHLYLSNISIVRPNRLETCGKCHETERDEFKGSQHFKELESGGEEPAPECITCHSAHGARLLAASRIEEFCGNCHNPTIGIALTVPKEAEKALSLVNELGIEISKARDAVISAKAKGKNVTEAERDLESAATILKAVPEAWHRFNLTYFETEVQQGIANAQKAEKKASESAKASGFEGILRVLGFIREKGEIK